MRLENRRCSLPGSWLSPVLFGFLLLALGCLSQTPFAEAQTLSPTVSAPGATLSLKKGILSSDKQSAFLVGTTDASVSATHTFQGPGVDIFVAKVDLATGQTDWLSGIGAAAGVESEEEARDIIEAPDGSIFACGDLLRGSYPGQTAGYLDPWLGKWDAGGTLQWITQIAAPSNFFFIRAGGVATDGSNSYFFTGSINDDFGTGAVLSSMDMFMFKVNAAGTVTIKKHIGTAETTGVGIGPSWGASAIDGAFLYHACSVGDSPVVFKIQMSDLSIADTRTITLPFNQQITSAVFDFSSNTVYIAGRVNVLIATVPGSTFGGAMDALMVAYDFSAFTTKWIQQFGADASDEYTSTFLDTSGRLHAVGFTQGAMPGEEGAGGLDQFHIILNATDGTTFWSAQTGTSQDDAARGAGIDSSMTVFSFVSSATVPTVYRATDPWACPPAHFFDASEKWSPCKPCPSGSVSASSASRSCTSCPIGSGVANGNTMCAVCAAGTYSLNGICLDCPEGTSAPLPGSVACAVCKRGTFARSGASQCTRCDLGLYQDELGQASCKVCPNDATTSSSGSSDINQCICATDQYGNPLGSPPTPCRDCNPNCQCDGGINQIANKGYWVASDDPSYVVTCTVASACPGGLGQCNAGYHSTGCSKCEDGYYFGNLGVCRHCDAWGPPVTTAVTLVIVGGACVVLGIGAALCLALTYSRNRSELLRAHTGLVAVVRISFAQVSTYQQLAIIFSLGTSISIPGGDVFKGMFGVFILDFSAFTGPLACLLGMQPPYAATYFGRIAGLVLVMAGATVVYVLVSLAKLALKARLAPVPPRLSTEDHGTIAQLPTEQPKDGHDEADQSKDEGCEANKPDTREGGRPSLVARLSMVLAQAVVIIALEFYFLLMMYIIEPFLCRERSAWEYAVMFRSDVACYSDDEMWIMTAVPSLVMSGALLLVPVTMVAVTIALAKKSWREGSLPRDATLRYLATVFAPVMHIKYDSNLYWWEMIILFRKIVFGLLLHIAFKGPNDQCTWVCLLFIVSLLIHNIFRPYRSQSEDIHEMISLIILVLTSFIVLLTSDQVSSISSYARTALHAVFFCLMAVHTLFYFKAVTSELTTSLPRVSPIRRLLERARASDVPSPDASPTKAEHPFEDIADVKPRAPAVVSVKEVSGFGNPHADDQLPADEAAKQFREVAKKISLERKMRLEARQEYELLCKAALVGDHFMYRAAHVSRINEWLATKKTA